MARHRFLLIIVLALTACGPVAEETISRRRNEPPSPGEEQGGVRMPPVTSAKSSPAQPSSGDAEASAPKPSTSSPKPPTGGNGGNGGNASDGGAAPPSDAGSPVAPVEPGPYVPNAKRVFETSKTFTPDLKTEGWASSGLEGADSLCNSAALAAGIGGTWRAWLSAPGVNAKDRIVDVSPWYLVDRRTLVFSKKVGLGIGAMLAQAPGIDVGPLIDIEMNEHGQTNSAIAVWTGTTKLGVASPTTCSGWSSISPNVEGLVGIGATYDKAWWTDSLPHPCSLKARLLCFEQ